jgi:predicted dehydrogenase
MKTHALLFSFAALLMLFSLSAAAAENAPFRIGIIGLDTQHAPMFAADINNPALATGCKVVAAFTGGTPDNPWSTKYIDQYVVQIRDSLKIQIVGTIDELLKKVDGVLLESVDGRPHLEQARQVIRAKKPLFVDKPMAASLADVIEIFRLAREAGVPCWSSSSLRYCAGISSVRNDPEYGGVVGCDAWSPCPLDEHHPDFFWYGIHGVETLFTVMGPGCEKVTRVQTKDTDVAVGTWNDGRIGTFRGLRAGKEDYGCLIFGNKKIGQGGGFTGYSPLVVEIVKFFKSGKPPVSPEETIEIYAFMAAADESKTHGGVPVSLREITEKAMKK